MFTLTDDERAISDTARDFAAEHLAPHAVEWDQTKHFPVDVLRKAASLGMGGIYIREDVGGSELTPVDAGRIFEQLAEGLAGRELMEDRWSVPEVPGLARVPALHHVLRDQDAVHLD